MLDFLKFPRQLNCFYFFFSAKWSVFTTCEFFFYHSFCVVVVVTSQVVFFYSQGNLTVFLLGKVFTPCFFLLFSTVYFFSEKLSVVGRGYNPFFSNVISIYNWFTFFLLSSFWSGGSNVSCQFNLFYFFQSPGMKNSFFPFFLSG